ncbi:hypothetical protein BDK51DRAFT_43235 [Blyttiomyces helicus]|uniref:Peroxidase n=1 Tax=Blyttiomyces helicus TaxID=388810 RepID=A0A4P9W4W8_9FUNG|nr:hypothetical protein BDK51DRAFT_43235 [Blyttiomyces helicus]|eukprot:RKO87411.1 hypothetical protein BDK51DRAFT_43235 [Blyttiomyces helicus]
MLTRILSAAVALAAMAPMASAGAGPSVIANRPTNIYQSTIIAIEDFILANGCGGEKAKNPATGRVLPPLWLRFIRFRIVNEFVRPGNEGLALADMPYALFAVTDPASIGTDALNSSILMTDMMNLAAIIIIACCGGPQIPFTSCLSHPWPDPEGLLPLPSDSSNLTVSKMDRMGLNASQIVAIVTGSHTMGGAHAAHNPQLTNEEFAPFDSTPTVFDKDIFKQVLNGKRLIPLPQSVPPAPTNSPLLDLPHLRTGAALNRSKMNGTGDPVHYPRALPLEKLCVKGRSGCPSAVMEKARLALVRINRVVKEQEDPRSAGNIPVPDLTGAAEEGQGSHTSFFAERRHVVAQDVGVGTNQNATTFWTRIEKNFAAESDGMISDRNAQSLMNR